MILTVGNLFDGIYGFGLGFEAAGCKVVWRCEIDGFCNKVMAARRPEVRTVLDVRDVGGHNLEPVDVVTFGFPCQDLSVAGNRAGLAGGRSGLFWEAHRILAELMPRWFIAENVPGLLSSNGGKDMGTVLGALGDLGYGLAYRILDAQWFGLAQRRKRVFVVGRLGDWRSAAKVLFEPESVCGSTPPGREERQDIARCTPTRARIDGETETFVPTVSRPVVMGSTSDHYDESQQTYVCDPLKGGSGNRGWRVNAEEAAEGQLAVFGFQGQDLSHAIRSNPSKADKPDSSTYVVAHTLTRRYDSSSQGTGAGTPIIPTMLGDDNGHTGFRDGDGSVVAGTLTEGFGGRGVNAEQVANGNCSVDSQGVRRLTPTECERLQGFPEGWTRIPVRQLKREPRTRHFKRYSDLYVRNPDGTWTQYASDGSRYKALGNAVAVPVVAWIARRIVEVSNGNLP